MSTPGPGVSTDQTPLVKANLEAHSEQSEASEIEAQGMRSLRKPSSDKENWTLNSMNWEGSQKPEIEPGHTDSIEQNSVSSPSQQMPHLSHGVSTENHKLTYSQR